MSIYCNKCGTSNIDNASFCKECGNNLAEQKRKAKEAADKARAEAENQRWQEEKEKAKAREEKRSSYIQAELAEYNRRKQQYSADSNKNNGSSSDGNTPALIGASVVIFIFVLLFMVVNAASRNSTQQYNTQPQPVYEANRTEPNATAPYTAKESEALRELNNADSLWNQEKREFSNATLAIQQLNHSIELNPTARAYNLRGLAYEQLGKSKQAIADYTEAIRLKPDGKVLYSNRGYAYYSVGNLSKAKADAKRACELGDCGLQKQIQNDSSSDVNNDKQEQQNKPSQNSNGKAIYDARCKACHGVDGKMKALGKSNPIAGSGTVEKDLEGYRAGTLNKHGMGSIMKGNAAALSDANIRDVAAYVASLGNSTSTSSKKHSSSSTEYSKKAQDTCSFWLEAPANRAEYDRCLREVDGK